MDDVDDMVDDETNVVTEPDDCHGCPGYAARNGIWCKRDGSCPPEGNEDE